MRTLVRVAALAAVCLLAHAQEGPVEGRIVGNTYRNERLGWEIAIPAGWTLTPRAEVARLENKGKEVIEKSSKTKIEPRHTQLLHLQKDPLNRLTSAAQKYDPEEEGPYEQSQEAVFRALLDAYRSQQIPVEVKRGKDSLGGLEFNSLHVSFLSRDGTKVVFQQIVYDRLINERSLMIAIMFNNEADRRALYGALKSSRFSATK